MADSAPINPDQPELRLLAQLSGLKPRALAGAANNPEHFGEHINAEQLGRYLANVKRLLELTARIAEAIDITLKKTLKAKGRN